MSTTLELTITEDTPALTLIKPRRHFSGLKPAFWRRARSLEIREKSLMCPILVPSNPNVGVVRAYSTDSTYY